MNVDTWKSRLATMSDNELARMIESIKANIAELEEERTDVELEDMNAGDLDPGLTGMIKDLGTEIDGLGRDLIDAQAEYSRRQKRLIPPTDPPSPATVHPCRFKHRFTYSTVSLGSKCA